MKMKWFWMVCMIVMTSLVAVSCGDDDDEGGESGAGNTPEGTVTVNLEKGGSSIKFKGNYGTLSWEAPNNFYGPAISVGKKNGLNNIDINNIPENGWDSYRVACEPGHAYIVRSFNFGANNEYLYYYAGVYVIKNLTNTKGEIIGAKVQYCNFTPGKGWNQ